MTAWTSSSDKYDTGLNNSFSTSAPSENLGTLKTTATRAVFIPKARHIDSRPCKSSEVSCSETEVMNVLNRMSLHQLSNKFYRVLRGARNTRVKSVNEQFRLDFVGKKFVEDVEAMLHLAIVRHASRIAHP